MSEELYVVATGLENSPAGGLSFLELTSTPMECSGGICHDLCSAVSLL